MGEGPAYLHIVQPTLPAKHNVSQESSGCHYTETYLLSFIQLEPKEDIPLSVKVRLKHEWKNGHNFS